MPLRLEPLRVELIPTFHELYRIIEVADEIPIITPVEEIEEYADDPGLDLGADGRLVYLDDQLVGYATVHMPPAGDSLARAFVMGGVHPSFRRQGIGTEVLSWQIGRAKEKLMTTTSDEKVVRTHSYLHEQSAIELYERNGFEVVRYFTELMQPLGEVKKIVEPAGIEIAPWSDERSEEVRQLFNLAFQDHWGSTPRTVESWKHHLAGFAARTDLSFNALANGQLVGSSLNFHYPGDKEVTGRLDGWIGTLGTHPDFRRRGIASTLIHRSMQAFREAGLDHALIGVDSESLTGANRLYESLGFVPLHRMVQHQLKERS